LNLTALLQAVAKSIEDEKELSRISVTFIYIEDAIDRNVVGVLGRMFSQKMERSGGRQDFFALSPSHYALHAVGSDQERREVLTALQEYANEHHPPAGIPVAYSVALAVEAWDLLKGKLPYAPDSDNLALLTAKIAEVSLEIATTEEVVHEIAKLCRTVDLNSWEDLSSYPLYARVSERLRTMVPFEDVRHLKRLGREKWAERFERMTQLMVAAEMREYLRVSYKHTSRERFMELLAYLYVAIDDEDDKDEDTFS
jgi:hypothetical protein